MGEIVNLNRVKKRRARAAEAEKASENRARHGRTPAERASDESAERLRERLLDQARIDADKPDGR